MDNDEQFNIISRIAECRARIDELDKKNISLSDNMYSDGEGGINKDDMQHLRRNNKEMYDLRMEVRKMHKSADKIKSFTKEYIAKKSITERENEPGNHISQPTNIR